MHVAKVNKIKNTFDNTFKNLRGRKVLCRVPFHAEPTEDHISPPTSSNGAPNSKFASLGHRPKSSYVKKSPKNNNSRFLCTKLAEKRSVSVNSLDELFLSSSSVNQKPTNKKSNRKKTKSRPFSPEYTVRRSRSRSACSLDKCYGSPKSPERTERRSSRKKKSKSLWEDEVTAEPTCTNSEVKNESTVQLKTHIDDTCAISPEKPKKRIYLKKNYVRKLDDVVNTTKRRSRSICTLGCCNSLPSSPWLSRKRVHKRNSLNNVSIPASQKDTKYLKSSMLYQREGILPTSQVVVEFRKKRVYRKKGVCDVVSMKPKRKPKISLLNFDDANVPSATVVVDISKRKTYRKKNSDLSAVGPSSWPRSELSTADLVDDNAIFTPARMMSQNGEIHGHNDAEINFSQSTVTASQTSDYVVQHQCTKRGRGRPRKMSVPVLEGLGTDDELTCTCSSTMSRDSQPARRSRKKRLPWEDDEEEQQQQQQEEEVSEYELLRRRNIEENMKMLRQIFMDQGLQIEEKSSDTPKMRKSYTRLPPPPPRPKSARIEVKRSSGSLDFSKFCHRLSIF